MLIIRRATSNDAGQLAEVHVRSWQHAYRGLIRQDYLDRLDPAQRAARWEQILASVDWPASGVQVAENESGLLGFVSFGPSRDDDAEDGQRSVGEIMAIYLAPTAWGQGIGRELMAAGLASLAAAGCAEVTLWVLESNERARGFYAAAGFKHDGTVKEDESHGFVLREVRYRRCLLTVVV